MRRRLTAVLVLAALLAGYAIVLRTARAQEPSSSLLTRAIVSHFELAWTRADGSHPFVAHCRRAHGGCAARARRMAEHFERAGARHDVDPWLLAAIALQESGGNPDAVGTRGEWSLMQLLPGSAHERVVRRLCDENPSECTAITIDGAARLVRSAIDRCGSEGAALGMYNRGVCGETDYSIAVLARRARMRGES